MAPPVPARLCTSDSEDIGRQFIDTWSRYISLLNNNTEQDVNHLLDLLEKTRKNWQICEAKLGDVLKKFQQSEAKLVELNGVEKKYEQCKAELDELKDVERKYQQCKAELDELKRRWKPTNVKILSPPPLATLVEDEIEVESENESKENCEDGASSSKFIDTPKLPFRMRRSMSVPFVNKSRGSTSSEDGNGYTSNNTSFGSPPRQGNISPTTPNVFCVNRIESRPHVFGRKRVFTKLVCHICTSNIRFGVEALKCQSCKLFCHQHCSRRAPSVCIPWSAPPKNANGRIRLGEYCANNIVPKLPHLVVRCVQYLNSEKLSRGLYVNHDYSGEADLLLQLILHERSPPELKKYGPQAAAHCLIKFLVDIRESLIPESSFKEFYDASKKEDNFEMEAVVSELPIVHRNTLAYLFIHWKILNEHCESNGLTVDVLSRVIIPVIMRGINTNLDQYLPIFPRLLSLSNAFWEGVIEEGVKFFAKTPISRSSSKKSQIEVSRSVTVARLQHAGNVRRG